MYKTIKTDTHLLLVSSAKEIGWNFNNGNKDIVYINKIIDDNCYYDINRGIVNKKDILKIVASYPKIDGVLEFETLPLTIEQRAITIFKEQFGISPITIQTHTDILKGIRATLKSEKVFSLEDMKNAYNRGLRNGSKAGSVVARGGELNFVAFEEDKVVKQLMSKEKKYEFIVKMKNNYESSIGDDRSPIIIDNKIQGVWQEIK